MTLPLHMPWLPAKARPPRLPFLSPNGAPQVLQDSRCFFQNRVAFAAPLALARDSPDWSLLVRCLSAEVRCVFVAIALRRAWVVKSWRREVVRLT